MFLFMWIGASWVACNVLYVLVFCMAVLLYTCGLSFHVVFIDSSARQKDPALGVQEKFPTGDSKVYRIVLHCLSYFQTKNVWVRKHRQKEFSVSSHRNRRRMGKRKKTRRSIFVLTHRQQRSHFPINNSLLRLMMASCLRISNLTITSSDALRN